jgi:hypothetical protein
MSGKIGSSKKSLPQFFKKLNEISNQNGAVEEINFPSISLQSKDSTGQ